MESLGEISEGRGKGGKREREKGRERETEEEREKRAKEKKREMESKIKEIVKGDEENLNGRGKGMKMRTFFFTCHFLKPLEFVWVLLKCDFAPLKNIPLMPLFLYIYYGVGEIF